MYSKQGIIFKAIIDSCNPDKCLIFQIILKMPNAIASDSSSFRNFAQKSKFMKRLHFRNVLMLGGANVAHLKNEIIRKKLKFRILRIL